MTRPIRPRVAELVNPLSRRRRLVTPLCPRAKKEIDVPGNLTRGAERSRNGPTDALLWVVKPTDPPIRHLLRESLDVSPSVFRQHLDPNDYRGQVGIRGLVG